MYNAHINRVHVEVTDRCNAECPVCPRSMAGGPIMPYVKNQELSLEYFKLLGKDFCQHIAEWNFCGTKGDPASAQDLFEILEFILQCNEKTSIKVRTNGGARNSNFWNRIGTLFKGTNCVVVWSIDGWEHTNHIYRKNVKWSKLFENLNTYIGTGAKSHWEFNKFAHNIEDIPTVSAFCNRHNIQFDVRDPYGFKDIIVTHKTAPGKKRTETTKIKAISVYDKSPEYPTKTKFAYYIYPHGILPDDVVASTDQEGRDISSWIPGVYDQNYYSKYKNSVQNIECKVSNSEGDEIYIDSNGMVFPCCYTASKYVMEDEQIHQMIDPYKDKLFVTKTNSIYDVLETELFKKVMPDGMAGKLEDGVGYCITCIKHCSIGVSRVSEVWD